MIIGLGYQEGAGQEVVAEMLVGRGFTHFSFATQLDSVLVEGLGLSWGSLTDEALRTQELAGWNGLTPLDVQARVWSGLRDYVGDQVWINALLAVPEFRECVDAGEDVVISDLRHLNEVFFVNGLGGYVVRVDCPGVGSGRGSDLSGFRNWDFYLDNSGDLVFLGGQVIRMLQELE